MKKTVKAENMKTGRIARESSDLVNIQGTGIYNATITLDVAGTDYLHVYVDPDNKVSDEPANDNYVLMPFVQKKLKANLSINTGFYYMAFLLAIILALTIIPSTSASNLTLQDLINSYNYDYTDGTINITAKNNYMIDTNSNSINDTLVFNLTSNLSSGTYYAYVDLDDLNGKIISSISKTLTTQDTNFIINFSTALLSQQRYNYTLRIEDSGNILVYEENSFETNYYGGYESGTSIIYINDRKVNNDLQINLTLNVTRNESVNITVSMGYNDSSISETAEAILATGLQVVS